MTDDLKDVPDAVIERVYGVGWVADGVGSGVLVALVLERAGWVGIAFLVALLMVHWVTWRDGEEPRDGVVLFVAFSAMPMVAGLFAWEGLYRLAGIVLAADYAMHFTESTPPAFVERWEAQEEWEPSGAVLYHAGFEGYEIGEGSR